MENYIFKASSNALLKFLKEEEGVIIRHNASVPILYEDGLHEKGSTISSTGALMAYSGKKTGRSPKDKRIVYEESSSSNIWWGPVNKQVDDHTWKIAKSRAIDYLRTKEKLFVVDAFAGWDPKYRLKVRIICARAYHALFMTNMLIQPTSEELKNFGEPDFLVYNAGQFPSNIYTKGMTSSTSIEINFGTMEMVILGSEYAGEMKKGIFTVMFYLMPIKYNILTLHSSCNQGIDKEDVTLFFGLSGTGKTTLSADPNRLLIGDDEHCWTDTGVFNIEGGCYAKCLNLTKENEPEIFDSIKFGSVLENVIYDQDTRVVDYNDKSLTENTRCAYPISYIKSAKIPCITEKHPKNIILLTCDASGVLPPISKLTNSQVMYHFISGYTSKIAGTEEGVKTTQSTFSACFGQPFLALHPMHYAQQLSDKISKHQTNAWLLNTGWSGSSCEKGGSRFSLRHTRAILNAIHSGELEKAEFETLPIFNLLIPKSCSNVPSLLLNPYKSWKDGSELYKKEATSLARSFIDNFNTYSDKCTEEVKNASPKI